MKRSRLAAVVVSTGPAMTGTVAVVAAPAEAHTGSVHDNCTNLNQKYPHGLGRNNDKGGNATNFKHSTRKYNRANRHNLTLDGDNVTSRARRPDFWHLCDGLSRC